MRGPVPRSARRLLAVALAMAPLTARAEVEVPRAIPADAAVVATARPLAIAGLLSRLGKGWDASARRNLPIPPAVSPFDPTLLSSLGIDPAAPVWAALRPQRGGWHLRAVLPLTEPRLAEAIVRSGAALANVKLDHVPGAWIGKLGKAAVVVRLDGAALVLDALARWGGGEAGTAELLRQPLRAPRPFDARRGTVARMSPSDAIAVWGDLGALATLGLAAGEDQLTRALVLADPSQRAALQRQGRAELATCRAAIKAAPTVFDDALLALVVSGPDQARFELALGGKRAALDALRPRPVRASRTLLPTDAEVDGRLQLVDAGPLRAALRPVAGREVLVRECPALTSFPIALRAWPVLLGRLSARAATQPSGEHALLRLLSGLRGAAVWLPSVGGPAVNALEGTAGRDLIALAELDDAARGDLDRALAGTFGATAPLRVGGRQLTAYTPPPMPWSTQEQPLVAVEVLPEGGEVVGLGARDRLRGAWEHMRAGAAAAGAGRVATLGFGSRLIARVLHAVRADPAVDFVEGVERVDGELALDDERLRLDIDVALRPPKR